MCLNLYLAPVKKQTVYISELECCSQYTFHEICRYMCMWLLIGQYDGEMEDYDSSYGYIVGNLSELAGTWEQFDKWMKQLGMMYANEQDPEKIHRWYQSIVMQITPRLIGYRPCINQSHFFSTPRSWHFETLSSSLDCFEDVTTCSRFADMIEVAFLALSWVLAWFWLLPAFSFQEKINSNTRSLCF